MSDNYDKLKAQYDAMRERENRDLIDNSQTVKDLRFGLKELTKERDEWKQIQIDTDNMCCKLTTLNEKLTADKQRMDWLENWVNITISENGNRSADERVELRYDVPSLCYPVKGSSFREVIDKAMKATGL